MNTWWDYQSVWKQYPWLLAVAIAAVSLLVAGVVGTVTASPLGFFFIPGLAALYLHHLLVQKRLDA